MQDIEQIYIEKYDKAGKNIQNFVSDYSFVDKIAEAVTKSIGNIVDVVERSESIKNIINLYLLEIKSVSEAIDDISEILNLDDCNTFFEKLDLKPEYRMILAGLISTNIQSTEEAQTSIQKENSSISHVDILHEIENPTPSLKTTLHFAKPQAQATPSGTPTNISNTANIPTPTTLSEGIKATQSSVATNSVLGGFSANQPTNPAQKISDMLNKNMETPSISIPKEVYIPKKPDPYKEPIV
jgi:hypothetical protein